MASRLIMKKRFQMLSTQYDSEQEQLSVRIKGLEKTDRKFNDLLSIQVHMALETLK